MEIEERLTKIEEKLDKLVKLLNPIVKIDKALRADILRVLRHGKKPRKQPDGSAWKGKKKLTKEQEEFLDDSIKVLDSNKEKWR